MKLQEVEELTMRFISNAITTSFVSQNKVRMLSRNELFIFQRHGKCRFHIYAAIIVPKNVRADIWNKINEALCASVIDVNAQSIRIEGFDKFKSKEENLQKAYKKYLNKWGENNTIKID